MNASAYAPLFVSIEHPFLSDADQDMLRHPWVGGIVIFSKNFTSRAQIQDLINEIKALKSPALLVCVDHEGGRVQRFRQEFTVLPPMRKLGQLYDTDSALALACAKACGTIIGTELGAVGVDFSFTPVLDLDYGQSSVIGDRSFHADPIVVTELAGALVDGLQDSGMQAIGKHFPGHGYVVKDSHLELPQDLRSLAEIAAQDLVPFQALHPKLAGMMTAHVLYKKVDPEIASFSAYWLKQVLRKEMGYQGLIFSDDLLMKATEPTGDVVARAKAALGAGCDVLLLCNDNQAILDLLSADLVNQPGHIDYQTLYYRNMAEPDIYQAALELLNHSRILHV